jgi:protoporphyrinogen oxidase
MGLAVAYQLTLEGLQPVLLEADDRLGGMAASFDFAGIPIERYYHFHCLSDHAFFQLLEELGLADQLRCARALSPACGPLPEPAGLAPPR